MSSIRDPFIGIDFGTTTSAIAWVNRATGRGEIIKNAEGEEKTRSIVYFGDATLVGTPAEYLLADPGERLKVVASVKRDLANPKPIALPCGLRVNAVEVAAAILAKLKLDAEELHFHKSIARAVITFPASFDILEQETLEEAAHKAGFEEVVLLEEPVAAALAYAREGLQVGRNLLVYDLGGGTFDVAIMTQEDDHFRLALEPRGIRHCGGDDFDQALYHLCDKEVKRLWGKPITQEGLDLLFLKSCRERKEQLSFTQVVHFNHLMEDGKAFKFSVTRDTFEALIAEPIAETIRHTQRLLNDAQIRGYPVETVVLVGGSSRIPLVLRMLQETLPVVPKKWQHQDIAIALGAAYFGASLWFGERSPLIRDKGIGEETTAGTVKRYLRVGEGEPYTTIVAALSDAQEGSEIILLPGVYRESLVLDKSIDFVAQGPKTLVVVECEQGSCLTMQAGRVLVRGVTFRGLASAEKGYPTVLSLQGQLILEDCEVTSQSLACVEVRGDLAQVALRYCTIRGAALESGILASDGSQGTVERCEIFANRLAGIEIRRESHLLVENCKIHHTHEGAGIFIHQKGKGLIENCDLFANQFAGIAIRSHSEPYIRGCKIYENSGGGVLVYDNGLGTIEGCDIYQNDVAGVEIRTNANPTFKDCRIHNNPVIGIVINEDGNGLIDGCEMFANRLAGIEISGSSNPILRRCRIYDSHEGNGVVIWGHSRGIFEDCDIFANRFAGVEILSQASPTFRRCKVYDSKEGSGLFIHGNGEGNMIDCDIFTNHFDGIVISDNGYPVISHCRVNCNRHHGVRVYDNGRARVEQSDLTGNHYGSWQVAENCQVQEYHNRSDSSP